MGEREHAEVPGGSGDPRTDARARRELRRRDREQAALRSVAELVARAAPPTDVFGAVAAGAARLLDGQATTLTRFDGDAELVVVAAHAGPAPVGARIAFERDTLPDRVLRTADVVRVDDYAGEPDAELAASFGLAAAVSAPVTVAGEVWGMLTATSGVGPLPHDTGPRLEQFARLVAAALGNSEARSDLRALASEQAALRRVAELVARGTSSDEVFVAVTNEASTLLGDLAVALMLYDDAGALVVATCNCPAPVGLHVPFRAGTAVERLFRTGRPAHMDTYEGTAMAEIARHAGIASTTAVPITVEGRVRAALVSSNTCPTNRDAVEARLAQFAELAAVAIANAETRAKLTASRARVVATADETRRRLQRDVHDGAQQRLVHTIIALKLARNALAAGSPVDDLVDEALANAERANDELRDIVHGILPASLTRGGLRPGLESLVADLAFPVEIRVDAPRLPAATETTAYFVVAEALTNTVKHARARRARVQVDLDGDALVVEVRDDGVGGADPSRGTGLVGLLDRVHAADGVLGITSPDGLGTTLRATLPCAPAGHVPGPRRGAG
jgi:signal transduction histidine kinase